MLIRSLTVVYRLNLKNLVGKKSAFCYENESIATCGGQKRII